MGLPKVRTPIPAHPPGWYLTVYPDAGEAGGSFQYTQRRHYTGVKGAAADPERALAEAGRRARGKVRRYCAANRLNRLGTLTYAPPFCTDPLQLRADVRAFFINLRSLLGGDAFPYVWVPEYHADGERFHVHFAVGRFVGRRLIEQAWGHGHVHIKLLSNLSSTSTPWHEARVGARYLAKYVAKSFEGERDFPGLRRYSPAEGFQPVSKSLYATTEEDLLSDAIDLMGPHIDRVWRSEEHEGWVGPPVVHVTWLR